MSNLGTVFGPAASAFVTMVAAKHMAWACLVLSNPASLGATPLKPLYVVSPEYTAAMLFAASGLALAAMRRAPGGVTAAMMVPQQFLMILAASGSLTAILSAQYGDGEFRPLSFIAADQSIHVILALWHVFVLATWFRRPV